MVFGKYVVGLPLCLNCIPSRSCSPYWSWCVFNKDTNLLLAEHYRSSSDQRNNLFFLCFVKYTWNISFMSELYLFLRHTILCIIQPLHEQVDIYILVHGTWRMYYLNGKRQNYEMNDTLWKTEQKWWSICKKIQ